MKIKFKDGITIEIIENNNESTREIYKRALKAKKVYDKYKNYIKDSTISRSFDPNVSFSIMNIKSAIKEDNQKLLDKELWYADRDIDSDLNKDKNYLYMYTLPQLEQIVDKYKDVVTALKKASPKYDDKVRELEEKISKLEVKFHLALEEKKVEESKEEVKEEVIEKPKKEPKKEPKEEPKQETIEKINLEEYEMPKLRPSKDSKLSKLRRSKDSKRTKDVPPFHDPTYTIKVQGDYRKSIIERASRWKDVESLKIEFPDVINSIEDDINRGSLEGQFAKPELRKVTEEYYYLAKLYEDGGLVDEANQIREKINKLNLVWHLTV